MIYTQRRDILSNENLWDMVEEMIDEVLEENIEIYAPGKAPVAEWDLEGLKGWVGNQFDFRPAVHPGQGRLPPGESSLRPSRRRS